MSTNRHIRRAVSPGPRRQYLYTSPEIRIQVSEPLVSSLAQKGRSSESSVQLSSGTLIEELKVTAESVASEWSRQGAGILGRLQEALGVAYKKDIIDVYVCPWGKQSISSPIILNSTISRELMSDVLLHELIHVLLTDNSSFSIYEPNEYKLIDGWRRSFGSEHSWNTLIHVPVHALLKHVYLDVLLEPQQLRRDIDRHRMHQDYRLAWEYVEDHNYLDIIMSLNSQYKNVDRQTSPPRHAA